MKKLTIWGMAAVLLLAVFGLSGCGDKASKYTEAEHIQRIAERIQKRYIDADLGWVDREQPTSFEVFPLYDENDKLKYFLVEFESFGFIYILLRDEQRKAFGEIGASTSMYKISASGNDEWSPNGGETVFNKSPYFVAGIKNERRYLLLGYIVAAKQGNTFVNLISQAEVEIINGQTTKEQVGIWLDFNWPKKDNDL
jgi:hypothetical protein